jgi:hypothetical protein
MASLALKASRARRRDVSSSPADEAA